MEYLTCKRRTKVKKFFARFAFKYIAKQYVIMIIVTKLSKFNLIFKKNFKQIQSKEKTDHFCEAWIKIDSHRFAPPFWLDSLIDRPRSCTRPSTPGSCPDSFHGVGGGLLPVGKNRTWLFLWGFKLIQKNQTDQFSTEKW